MISYQLNDASHTPVVVCEIDLYCKYKNQLNNPYLSLMLLQNSKLFRQVFFAMAFLLIAVSGISQVIQKMNDELSLMQTSPDKEKREEGVRLKSLVNDLQPALYLKRGELTRAEEGSVPLKIITDAVSIDQLYTGNALYKSVRMVCVKIERPEDLKSALRLADLKGFSKLKYIHFLCSFKICAGQGDNNTCELEKISAMVNGKADSVIKILYTSTTSE
ncbi:MAG: hypothetical protein JNL63_09550 [Bacteroidia bacterium]|nr:hypothetical protein [Bacteroidia bacterium]